MSDLRVVTEPLAGGPLARAEFAGTAPTGWYLTPDVDADAWRTRAERVLAGPPGPGWLDTLAPAIEASGAAAAGLATVAGGRGVVVTTGQQPGLFGGPIFTLSKALSALALADAIQRETGLPVAPVFWAATDDADFDEAAGTVVALAGAAERLRVERTVPEGTIMARVPLGDVSRQLATLERAAGSATYAEALRAARDAYAPGATVGGAYVRLLRWLLEPLGIAVLDAAHPATRAAAFPLLREALERAGEVERALHDRTAELEGAGFEPQVAEVHGLSLVFEGMDSIKRRVPADRAARVAREAAVGDLGANVLLRPVVERSLLPTVAYVAGPGEFAYFAQVSAVADALGKPRHQPVPRWSGTIIEPRVAEITERLGLSMDELRDPHAAETRLAREALPADIASALAAFRAAADELADRRGRARGAVESLGLPPAVMEGFRRQVEHRLERLERRLVAAAKRREATQLRDIGTARASLFPFGKRQERALGWLPFLARYGPVLIDAMREQARAHAGTLVRSPSLPLPPPAEITLL